MSNDYKSTSEAFMASLVLAFLAVGSDAGRAANVSSNVYTLPVGDSPASIVNGVLFDGKYIWAAVQNPDGGVLIKISRSGVVLSTTAVGSSPDEMAYDGANVWLTDYASSDVTIVNAAGNVINTIPLPSANPEGIVFDGQYVWVANNGVGANSVTKFDAASQTQLATYPVGLNPDGVAFDGTYIWVTNSYNNNVWTIDRNTGAFVNSYSTGIFPVSIVYDGANMWVGNGTGVNVGVGVSGLGTVTKIRAADGTILGSYTVGNHVRGMVYDGSSIWVCNGNDSTVSRLRATDVALLGVYATGNSPRAVAFDGSKIWVANSGADTLTVIIPNAQSPTAQNALARGLNVSAGFGGGNAAQAPGRPNNRVPNRVPHGSNSAITPVVVTQRDPAAAINLSSMLGLLFDAN
jgi:DNA-binding beta-propeller fold protein YncE